MLSNFRGKQSADKRGGGGRVVARRWKSTWSFTGQWATYRFSGTHKRGVLWGGYAVKKAS